MTVDFAGLGKTINGLRDTAKNCPEEFSSAADVYGIAIVNTMSEVFPPLADAYDRLTDEQVNDLHNRLTLDVAVATQIASEVMSMDETSSFADRVLAAIEDYEESCLGDLGISGALKHG